ncbi:hypothetical protein LSUE1_G005604 [Lachnellula suecica]|uniref:Protein kinase domain-containing protein n=1 Tax=Lachnellula suecica TaxID=602035 RepID=A0A8T9C2N7_9HELO|nr:hypothetical protein LSUE1_G005604 [Lachnellula suecica]
MANEFAKCQVRLDPESDVLFTQPDETDSDISTSENQTLIELTSCGHVPLDIRLKWLKEISGAFLGPSKSTRVRDFDLILKADGSIQSLVNTASDEKEQLRKFPSRYQIPEIILERFDSVEEKIKRTELFALGCILYELISGSRLFPYLNDEEIQAKYADGKFPEDVWELSKVVRILACWCPEFAKELLSARDSDTLREKFVKHVQKHPVLFGFQVLGGIATVASVVTLPILGAVGFGALGPAAGSAVAGWQASIGLVEAGSIFAWCQSAVMGGAALGGILATGLGGAGVAVSATVAGALDVGLKESSGEIKEKGEAKQKQEQEESKTTLKAKILQGLRL